MNFDAVVISEDKYFVNAIKQELSSIGFSCGVGMHDIGEASIIIYDVTSESLPLKSENDIIYVLSHNVSADICADHTVFVKPFIMSDFLQAFSRLKAGPDPGHAWSPEFSISVCDTFLIVCGKRIDLTKNEMLIFDALWENKGKAVGREHLEAITRANSNGNMVAVYINRLREKISSATDKKIILTVRDKGYKIVDD